MTCPYRVLAQPEEKDQEKRPAIRSKDVVALVLAIPLSSLVRSEGRQTAFCGAFTAVSPVGGKLVLSILNSGPVGLYVFPRDTGTSGHVTTGVIDQWRLRKLFRRRIAMEESGVAARIAETAAAVARELLK